MSPLFSKSNQVKSLLAAEGQVWFDCTGYNRITIILIYITDMLNIAKFKVTTASNFSAQFKTAKQISEVSNERILLR